MDSHGEQEEQMLRERVRRLGLSDQNDDIGDDERRARRRRLGWSEEALEEHDRRRAIFAQERLLAYAEYEQLMAREREEEEEWKRRDPAATKAMVELRVPAVGETAERGCAVCLEAFVDGGRKLRMMPCSHAFHQRCIFDWLHRDRRCPVCRFELPSRREEEQQQTMLSCQSAASV